MDVSTLLFKVCGIALISSVILMILGRMTGGMDVLLRIGSVVLIFGVALSVTGENVVSIMNIADIASGESGFAGRSLSIMLKALGIGFVSKFCADICRDCGENTLAGGVESTGRIAIISLCIPIVNEIIELAVKILEMGE